MEALKILTAYHEGSRKKMANRKDKREEKIEKVSPLRIKSLAEGIILQAMEDLWDKDLRDESYHFFKGEGFKICAGLACLDGQEQSRIMSMIADSAMANGKFPGQ